MVTGFTEETGIKVEFRNGSDSELANQIVQEGAASPADVFLTENSPAMTLVVRARACSRRWTRDTLAQVPAAVRASTKDWIGFAARSTVLVYNPSWCRQAQLPASMMDLADPRVEGQGRHRRRPAPTSRRSSARCSRSRARTATSAWLKGLKANAQGLPATTSRS